LRREDVVVRWPSQSENTRGLHINDLEAVKFFRTIPHDDLINTPYKILFQQVNHSCSVADLYGTMKGPMKTSEGRIVQPTGKSFHVEFCTVATWNNKGEITEERLFYDQVGLMKQIGHM